MREEVAAVVLKSRLTAKETPQEAVARLEAHRVYMAGIKKIEQCKDSDQLTQHALDTDPLVRNAVASNHFTPDSSVELLTQDPESFVRFAAERNRDAGPRAARRRMKAEYLAAQKMQPLFTHEEEEETAPALPLIKKFYQAG